MSRKKNEISPAEEENAVFVKAEAADDLMFYGRGAGGAPTASAVVGDVVRQKAGEQVKELIRFLHADPAIVRLLAPELDPSAK